MTGSTWWAGERPAPDRRSGGRDTARTHRDAVPGEDHGPALGQDGLARQRADDQRVAVHAEQSQAVHGHDVPVGAQQSERVGRRLDQHAGPRDSVAGERLRRRLQGERCPGCMSGDSSKTSSAGPSTISVAACWLLTRSGTVRLARLHAVLSPGRARSAATAKPRPATRARHRLPGLHLNGHVSGSDARGFEGSREAVFHQAHSRRLVNGRTLVGLLGVDCPRHGDEQAQHKGQGSGERWQASDHRVVLVHSRDRHERPIIAGGGICARPACRDFRSPRRKSLPLRRRGHRGEIMQP